MAKFPYLTGRTGHKNLYYKRPVPLELRADGRPEQIWRSLKTSDRKKAEKAYAKQHVEIELLFDQWRKEDDAPRHSPGTSTPTPGAAVLPIAPLTPGLLRRLADAHYLSTYETDFQWRGGLWRKVHEDEAAFWRGEIIKHPVNDWRQVNGQPSSYYACASRHASAV